MNPDELVALSASEVIFDPVPVRRCRKCETWLPETEEFFHRRSGYLQRICRKCRNTHRREQAVERRRDPAWRARQRENNRAFRERTKGDPQREANLTRYRRDYWERLRRDPVRHARHLENQRLREALRRRARGAAEVPQRSAPSLLRFPPSNTDVQLDAGPFREWLRRRAEREESLVSLSHYLRIDSELVRRVWKGRTKTVLLSVVDQALTSDGGTGLWELYPELCEEAA